MYDKIIKEVLNINNISSSVYCKRFITQKLKSLEKKRIIIFEQFINRLKNRIYSWYVDSDFLLLKFMCYRGCFWDDIFEKRKKIING